MLRVGILPGLYHEVVSPGISRPDHMALYWRIFVGLRLVPPRKMIDICFNRGRVAIFQADTTGTVVETTCYRTDVSVRIWC